MNRFPNQGGDFTANTKYYARFLVAVITHALTSVRFPNHECILFTHLTVLNSLHSQNKRFLLAISVPPPQSRCDWHGPVLC